MSTTTEIPTNDKDDKLLYLITFRKSLNDIYVKYVFLNNNFIFADDNQSIKFTEGYKLATDEKITDDFKEVVTITEQTADSYILLFTKDGKISHKSDLVIITNELITGNFEKVNLEDFISHDAITDIVKAFEKQAQIQEKMNKINGFIKEYNTNIGDNVIQFDAITENDNAIVNKNFKGILSAYNKIFNDLLNITYFRKFVSVNLKNQNKDSVSETADINTLYDTYSENIKDILDNIEINLSNYKDKGGINDQVYKNLSVDKNKPNTFIQNITDKPVSTKAFTEYLSEYKNKNFQKIDKSAPETIHFILNIIDKSLQSLSDNKTSELLRDLHDQNNKKYINTLIRNSMKNNVLTFLKLRNDQKNLNTYNRRFDIQINRDNNPKNLILKYNDDNKEYYIKNDQGVLIPNKTEFPNAVGNNINITDYKRKYIFGEFTRIFTPELSNEDIAKEMKIITDMLKSESPKPVFIMGYGASGAGKTSTLIYFNKEKKDGILIELCNEMGENEDYDEINLDFYEFYNSDCTKKVGTESKVCSVKDNDTGKNKTFIENPVSNCKETINFKYVSKSESLENATYGTGNYGFLLANEYNHKNHHEFRVNKVGDGDGNFPQWSKIGDVIRYLIDTDRHVKATTNNPNSSRSHSLIFVNLKKGNKNAYLIVGDFAGVENEFNCDNPTVLTAFQDIKDDRTNKRFYENEKDGEILDPIGSEKNCNEHQTQGGGDGPEDNTENEVGELFDFEHPNYSKIKSQTGHDLNGNDKSIQMIRKMVDIKKIKENEPTKITDEYILAPTDKVARDNYNTKYSEYKKSYTILKSFILNEQVPETETLFTQIDSNTVVAEYDSMIANVFSHELGAKNELELYRTLGTPAVISSIKFFPSYLSKGAKFNYNTLKDTFKVSNFKKYPELIKIGFIETFISKLKTLDNQKLNITSSTTANFAIDIILEKVLEPLKLSEQFKIYFAESTLKVDFDEKYNSTENLRNIIVEIYGNTYKINKNDLYTAFSSRTAYDNQKLIDIGNIVFDSKFFEFIRDEDYKRTDQLMLMQQVCTHRRTEGYFINDSLKNARDIIRMALKIKNKDALEVVPNYIDFCFDKYCPTHENCFSLDNETKNIDYEKSVIFNKIFEYLNDKNYLTITEKDIPEGETLPDENTQAGKNKHKELQQQKMYGDLLICVFCVFNISFGANNPPPVPYVDINELKRVVYANPFDDKDRFIKEGTNLIKAIDSGFIDMITNENGDKIPHNKLEELKQSKLQKPDNVLTRQPKEKQDMTTYDMFKFLIEHFKNAQTMGGEQKGGAINAAHQTFEKNLINFIDLEISRIDLVVDHIENNIKRDGFTIGKRNGTTTVLWDTFYNKWYGYFNKKPTDVKNQKLKYDNMRQGIMTESDNKLLKNPFFQTVMPNAINKEKINVFKPTGDKSKPEETQKDLERIKSEKTDLQKIKEIFINRHITTQELDEKNKKNAQEEVRKQQAAANQPTSTAEIQPTPTPTPHVVDKTTLESNWGFIDGDRETYTNYIKDFIDQIDNINAISAVGTIEFMDKLSKLDMVATICNDEDEQLIPKFKENDIELRPLYEKPSGGDSKRYTKRKGVSNNKTRKNRV